MNNPYSVNLKKSLQKAALSFLARRDYAKKELVQKLSIKFAKSKHEDLDTLILEVVEEYESLNYLDDLRFAHAFARSKVERGQGRMKIEYELGQKGVTPELIALVWQELEPDWCELAEQVRQKKFGEDLPEDYQEKAKQMRFLNSRGFDFEVIRLSFED